MGPEFSKQPLNEAETRAEHVDPALQATDRICKS